MKRFILKDRKLNIQPVKNALYTLQVIVIALAIPLLCVAEITHSENLTQPEISVNNQHHPNPLTVNI